MAKVPQASGSGPGGLVAKRQGKRRLNHEGSFYQRKNGVWEGAITVGVTASGKQRRRSVQAKSLEEAKRKFRALVRDFEDGKFDEEHILFKDAVADWLRAHRHNIVGRTTDIYAGELRHACRFFGDKPIANITAADIRKMQTALAEQVGPPTAKKVRDRTWAVLEVAYRDELLPRNVASVVTPVKVTRKKVVIWSSEEIDLFLETARGHRLYGLFYLYLATGARRSEALALRWEKLHWDTLEVDIHHTLTTRAGKQGFGPPKTAAGYRTIPAAADLFAVLGHHRERQQEEKRVPGYTDLGLVFPAPDGTILNSLDGSWRRLKAKAGKQAALAAVPFELTDIRIHDLRHTFVSMCVARGMDAARIAKIIGHSDPSFTYKTYAHVFEKYQGFSLPSLDALKGSKRNDAAAAAAEEQDAA